MAIRCITALFCLIVLTACSDETKFVGTWELTSVEDYGMGAIPEHRREMFAEDLNDEEYLQAMQELQDIFAGTIRLEIQKGGKMAVELMGSKYQATYAVRERSINLLMQDTPVGEFWMARLNEYGQLEASSAEMGGLTFIFTKQGR